MPGLTLHELIQAIAGSVAEAQDRVQSFQISSIRNYFDEYNRPKSVDIRLPSLSQDAEPGEERLVHVPLLSLSGVQLLKIKDVAVEFEVGLGSLEDGLAPPEGQPAAPTDTAPTDTAPTDTAPTDTAPPDTGDASSPPTPPPQAAGPAKILGVDIGAPRNRGSGSTARVTITVESQEPSDGMVRLIQHLDKLI